MRRPEPERSSVWPFVVCVAGGLVAAFLVRAWVSPSSDEIPRRAERSSGGPFVVALSQSPVVSLTAPALVPAAIVVASSSPTIPAASPTARTGSRMRVAGTDGRGVVLHASPGAGRQPAGFLEGARVTVLSREGEWAQVRGDNNLEGWVLAVYLVPAE